MLAQDFEPAGNRLHVARLCLLSGRDAEARLLVKEAAHYGAHAPAYVLVRLIWFQIAFALLDQHDSLAVDTEFTNGLGRLKTALENDASYAKWTMQPVLEHLKPKLSMSNHALLTAIVAALSDRANVTKLDEFPAWREAIPRPLE